MKRTISLKLCLSQEDSDRLLKLQLEFTASCNLIANVAHSNECYNHVALHHLCYYDIRNKIPLLGSQMICNAVKKIAFSYKALKKRKLKEIPLIKFKETSSVHFDKRTYSMKGDVLSLYTLDKRIKVKFKIGSFQLAYLNQAKIKEGELIRKGKRWFFNLVLDLPEALPCNKEKVLAIDLGENNLATTSTGTIFGGGKLRYKRDQFLGFRRRLQSKGTQSSKQLLKKVSGREERHIRQTNHEISKKIIAEAKINDVGIIVMEDLTNIRQRIRGNKRMRSRLHRWAFNQLQEFIDYKAQGEGMKVIYICPAFSSVTCSICLAIGNRKKHRFTCSTCGNQQHSDRNACQNLCRFAASADVAMCAVNRTYVAA